MTPAAATASPPATVPPDSARLLSLDAFRGAIMVFLVSVGFGFKEVAKKIPDSPLWRFLGYHTDHTMWVGGGAWDMIQPAFMFMVGVAVPYSYAARLARGDSFGTQLLHATRRALILIGLGVLIASNRNAHQTVFMFTNVLAQIGLGYGFLFLLVGRGWKVQLGVIAAIAVGYWLLFALHPLPAAGFDYRAAGVLPREQAHAVLPGAFAPWSKGANFAADFDRWFLNLFPAEKPFAFNAGGYQTLNFVPSLITMILGLMAGEFLRRPLTATAKVRGLIVVAVGCVGLGVLAGVTVCPLVKRIWTPSWAIYSGGVVLGALAAFHYAIEVRGWRRWAAPLAVVGMNSIAIYLLDIFVREWLTETLRVHFRITGLFEGPYGIIALRCAALAVLWAVCGWMHRRKLFLKI